MAEIGDFNDGNSLGENVSIVDGADGSKKVKVSSTKELSVENGLSVGTGPIKITVGTSAVQAKVGASPVNNQKSLTIHALNDMFWGYTNAVTASGANQGFPLYKNQTIVFAVTPANPTVFSVWLIAASAGKEALVAEATG